MTALGRGCVKTQNLKKFLGQHCNINHLVYWSNLVIPQLSYIARNMGWRDLVISFYAVWANSCPLKVVILNGRFSL
jgi:hypothetical protein